MIDFFKQVLNHQTCEMKEKDKRKTMNKT